MQNWFTYFCRTCCEFQYIFISESIQGLKKYTIEKLIIISVLNVMNRRHYKKWASSARSPMCKTSSNEFVFELKMTFNMSWEYNVFLYVHY